MTHTGAERRRQMISEAAYLRAERRGFRGGDPVEDWLEAEKEIDAGTGDASEETELEVRLASVNDRLSTFRKKIAELSEEAREEWESDVEALARHRDHFRQRIRDVREQTGHAAEKTKQQAERIWDEIVEAIDRLAHRKEHGS